jgi:hypothetical protein
MTFENDTKALVYSLVGKRAGTIWETVWKKRSPMRHRRMGLLERNLGQIFGAAQWRLMYSSWVGMTSTHLAITPRTLSR